MTESKLSIRPVLKKSIVIDCENPVEKFQNETLRPILKLQNELLVLVFENYIQRKKREFSELTTLKKEEVISEIFKNDISLKTEIKGLIIGHFTVNEYLFYQKEASECGKRILQMAKERIISNFQS